MKHPWGLFTSWLSPWVDALTNYKDYIKINQGKSDGITSSFLPPPSPACLMVQKFLTRLLVSAVTKVILESEDRDVWHHQIVRPG